MGFIPSGAMPRWFSTGNNLLLKAEKVCVERIQRHLHRVERKACIEHRQVDVRILVAGEAHKPDLALLFGFRQRFGCTAGPNKQLRIVIEADTMNLP
jgi:hypothetical protein